MSRSLSTRNLKKQREQNKRTIIRPTETVSTFHIPELPTGQRYDWNNSYLSFTVTPSNNTIPLETTNYNVPLMTTTTQPQTLYFNDQPQTLYFNDPNYCKNMILQNKEMELNKNKSNDYINLINEDNEQKIEKLKQKVEDDINDFMSEMRNKISDKLGILFDCYICFDEHSKRNMITLNCNHKLCDTCYANIIKDDVIICPFCRIKHNI